jgi:rhodanese-related sulfurtransferase
MRSIVLLAALLLALAGLSSAAAAEFQLITKEELKPQLGGAELIIIDGRSQAQRAESKVQIPGSVWIAEEKIDSWVKGTSKDKKLVIYCA